MTNKIKKTDNFYQESLIWMGYRYAIGLTDKSRKLLEQFKVYRDIEYDSPAFHELAAEIANYLKRKKIKDVVDLSNRWMESDMMWYSIHYALGRKSYAGSHCHDIVRSGRNVLSPERREFCAYDIRREISWHLNISLNFHLRNDAEQRLNPIDLLMRFMLENDIRTDEQLAMYKWIEVKEGGLGDISYNVVEYEEEGKKRCSVGLLSDIGALLDWDDLAKYFDPKFHKRCRVKYKGEESVVEYFDSWNCRYGKPNAFPFQLVKKPIDKYEQNPSCCMYINEDFIVEDNL